MRVARKGGRRDALAIYPQTATRLRLILSAPATRPISTGPCSGRCTTTTNAGTNPRDESRRHRPCGPEYAGEIGLDRGYSAHSVRATFIATALENGAKLEDVQNAAGHRDPGTTKLYDRRGYNPEKAASFFATY